jgi:hypothetical protein
VGEVVIPRGTRGIVQEVIDIDGVMDVLFLSPAGEGTSIHTTVGPDGVKKEGILVRVACKYLKR